MRVVLPDLIPEMEIAGEEALKESRRNRLTDVDTAKAVFWAMQAVYAIYVLNQEKTIH